MTDLRFLVNGVDFSRLVHKNGIRTYMDPVFDGQITTLAGVRKAALRRYRAILHVTLNDLEQSESAKLSRALLAWPLEITYFNLQRNEEVTQTMRLEGYPRERLLQDGGENWLSGTTLKFEQE